MYVFVHIFVQLITFIWLFAIPQTVACQIMFIYACVLSYFSCGQLFPTLWAVALQAPLSMGFSRQEYWSGLPCPLLGILPDPRIKPVSPAAPALQAASLPLSHQGIPHVCVCVCVCVCVRTQTFINKNRVVVWWWGCEKTGIFIFCT